MKMIDFRFVIGYISGDGCHLATRQEMDDFEADPGTDSYEFQLDALTAAKFPDLATHIGRGLAFADGWSSSDTTSFLRLGDVPVPEKKEYDDESRGRRPARR
jgi:hypothetical protein